MILAIICGGIFMVFDGATKSAANSIIKNQAFEVAQQNIERLLASSYIKEGLEYGVSEKYPAIEWQTSVETFYEPITKRLWARAVCTANYRDADSLQQKVELTNWLTDLSQTQVLELIKRKIAQKALLAQSDRLINTIEDAADYAQTDVNTIQQWVDNGMPVTEDGVFIKDYLDLYKKYNGNPPPDQKAKLDNYFSPVFWNPSQNSAAAPGTGQPGLTKPGETNPTGPPKPGDSTLKPPDQQKQTDPIICGKRYSELPPMSFDELWKFIQSCPEILE